MISCVRVSVCCPSSPSPFSAGERGLADRLVHTGFLLLAVGQSFLAYICMRAHTHGHAEWRSIQDWSLGSLSTTPHPSQVLLTPKVSKAATLQTKTPSIHSPVNFEQHTLLMWLLVTAYLVIRDERFWLGCMGCSRLTVQLLREKN